MPTAQHPSREPLSSITLVSWTPNRPLEFPEWAAAGRRLGAMGRCCQWTIGDWIRYGNARFGERYAPAAQITGYDIQTHMNMVHVASKFEISRRRENLSWSHHETVAGLPQDEQEHWLDLALAEKFSIADLRTELRASRRGQAPANKRSTMASLPATASPSGPLTKEETCTVCPTCGQPVPGSAG